MSEKITVGQILYRWQYGKIQEYEVERVGRKYFYCKNEERYPIEKETLEYKNKEYSNANFQLYLTKQEILDFQERMDLIDKIQIYFRRWDWYNNLPLEHLRHIKTVIGEPKNES